MKESVAPETLVFWKRSGAGSSYDREFASLTGWYVHVSEAQPFLDLIGPAEGVKILDVGCGTGRILTLLNPKNEITGLDLSPDMLEVARKKVPHAKFVEGSATELPFADASFDFVLTSRALQHIRDQKKAMSELARVCRPGGRVIVLTYNSWSLLCLYKHLRMSRLAKVLNIPLKPILKHRSFLNPWGFTYDNYCSAPELAGWMRELGLVVDRKWGGTLAMPWLLNDLFIGKILQTLVPTFFRAYLSAMLFLDRTIARVLPLSLFADKVIVSGVRR